MAKGAGWLGSVEDSNHCKCFSDALMLDPSSGLKLGALKSQIRFLFSGHGDQAGAAILPLGSGALAVLGSMWHYYRAHLKEP